MYKIGSYTLLYPIGDYILHYYTLLYTIY